MNHYSFPGYPIFLKKAALELGRPGAELPAQRLTAFTAMANLCAQAGSASADDVQSIIEKAAEFQDQLHVAALAADLMIEEVRHELLEVEKTGELPGKQGGSSHSRNTKRKS